MTHLEAFREWIDTPIFVLCGTQGIHSVSSQHYLGKAVDILFPLQTLQDLPDLFLGASRFPFTGIGIYPHWGLSGVPIGGLHLDIREAPQRALWLCTIQDGKQAYSKLTWKSLDLAMTEALARQETKH